MSCSFRLFAPAKRHKLPFIFVSPHLDKTHAKLAGEVKVQIHSEKGLVDSVTLPVADAATADLTVPSKGDLAPGFYTVSATFSAGGTFREFYQNGYWVEADSAVNSGPVLGVHGDFLTEDGKPFLPVSWHKLLPPPRKTGGTFQRREMRGFGRRILPRWRRMA